MAGNAYLDIAERILLDMRRPMTPTEILNEAFLRNIVPPHLHGRTQYKTLHARLSEDISRRPETSRFVRTAPGCFFLSTLRADKAVPNAYKAEYRAPQRRKELKREKVLTVPWHLMAEDIESDRRIPAAKLRRTLEAGQYTYANWRELSKFSELASVYSFVVVHREDKVLSFRSGKFIPHSDPIRGMRSLGFGGPIFASDIDMLYDSFFGIVSNAVNELVYGLGLPRRLAERARYTNEVKPHFGAMAISEKSKLRHLHVVMSYHCPDDFTPTKKALSLNDLRWVLAKNPTNSVDLFDQTSRLLMEQGYISSIIAT